MVRVWPGRPKITSWSATKPGSRMLCTPTPPSSPPRVPSSVTFSGIMWLKGLFPRRAGRRIELGRVVHLDHLGRLEMWGRDFGQVHHQHRADREVGRDDSAEALFLA